MSGLLPIGIAKIGHDKNIFAADDICGTVVRVRPGYLELFSNYNYYIITFTESI